MKYMFQALASVSVQTAVTTQGSSHSITSHPLIKNLSQ